MVYLIRLYFTYIVSSEKDESVVNQHNKFRKMLYSNNETTCFGL